MKAGANGYRLPTEAEWEYAARGGGTPSTTGSFAYKWAGTNTDEDILDGLRYYAWYSVNSSGDTHPVGGKTANGAQLYDMSGNVWEWCWDRRGTISTVPVTDPTGPALGSDRVFRGGSWNLYASACAVAARSNALSSDLRPDLGFRVACGN
jgi:formylglycine-generating enzyme required for sulfatase activity